MQKNQLLILSAVVGIIGGAFVMSETQAEFVRSLALVSSDQPAKAERQLGSGSLIRSTKSLVYYLGVDNRLHPFLNPAAYHSWYGSLGTIQVVSESKLREYQVGTPVCVKPGTWLIGFSGLQRVYAVEPGCVLRPLRSEAEALILYGPEWRLRLTQLDLLESNLYSVRGLSAADPAQNILDRDADGVSHDGEKKAGASDIKEDTDFDRVSDYEEIYYWFTDPAKKDTDGDGVDDGTEIVAGLSPTGAGSIKQLPSGTYRLPRGSLHGSALFTHKNAYAIPEESGGSPSSDVPELWQQGKLMPL